MTTDRRPSPDEVARLERHAASLASLVGRAVHPLGGFGWLDPDNRLAPERGVHTWISCRMTHVAALAVMRGDAAARPLLDVGFDALAGPLADGEHGGWYASAGDEAGTKAAYAHAFVILAAASLTAAGHPGGPGLLDEALLIFDTYFYDAAAGLARESYEASWSACEDYRGVNANMHTVEAYLAAGDVLGDRELIDRAVGIVERVVHGFAREAGWRLPEHFDGAWRVLRDYNADAPADQFRPYGVTVGHLYEWSRLCLNARAALAASGRVVPDWMRADAVALYRAATERGWAVDGADGHVYTTDFEDRPIVRERLHWVCCEAIAAAWTLYELTGEEQYLTDYGRYWAFADAHLLDHARGGWRHELDESNRPSERVWWGKPDLYHAYQAALTPVLPGLVSFAGAASRG